MFKLLSDESKGLEVWAAWDDSAEVYELFTDAEGEGYIGCADTKQEAVKIARWWTEGKVSSW
jgi:hypothetical protein